MYPNKGSTPFHPIRAYATGEIAARKVVAPSLSVKYQRPPGRRVIFEMMRLAARSVAASNRGFVIREERDDPEHSRASSFSDVPAASCKLT